jgi:hypothetical protein
MQKALFTVSTLGLMILTPRIALACPVCFGASDAPMALATNMGIIFMLGVVGAVLTGFATFFVYLMRRARLAEQIEPQKGTA